MYKSISASNVSALKQEILKSGLTVPEMVRVAWGSAASFRASDLRGGANGARIALAPQKDWEVNNPAEVGKVLARLGEIRNDFGEDKISLADLIVLAGATAIEKAASDAGVEVTVPFVPGRGDATQETTDVASFDLLELHADAFRNYFNKAEAYQSPTEMLVDRADQLNLTVPETVVLLGGLRALDANTGGARHGVFTDEAGSLSNDFFVNLMDMSIQWRKSGEEGIYEGVDRETGRVMFTATPVDLIFGSNSELRAVAEVYAYDNAKERFVNDFIKAWTKVMNLDRFDS
jgi:catalase-peroxidase